MKNKARTFLKSSKMMAFIFGFIFFIAALTTLKNYNISWDEPTHFKRGQAYLHYFLTGEKTYESLPPYSLEEARRNPKYHERSMYQEDGFDAQYHLEKDGDHPPLNDILASFTNYVFYQKLGIMDDVESYHLFEIFVCALLVAYIFLFAYEAFGFWPGVFSAVFLATYPLFWGESHFNIKDPIETAFFSITLYYIWKSINEEKEKMLISASIFAGFALGTKLNIVFLPFIVFPWMTVLAFIDKGARKFILSKKFVLLFTLIPFVAFAIFAVSWPWLLQDVVKNTFSVLGYYKDIGTESSKLSVSAFFRWNFYALKWIIYSTPPILLAFASAGIFAFRKIKNNSLALLLIVFWLLMPILRVSIPGASIYGGVRQIMEYIPALAILGGTGASLLIEKIKGKYQRAAVLFFIFISLIVNLVRLHPNENVYLNKFIGGVSGGIKLGFPSAGFSFGNAYLQGLNWINENAEPGAKLALVQGTVLNIPAYKIRPDIDYSNAHWSGIERKGEYLIDLTYNYELKFFPYAWEYVETMLEPVFQANADGLPILTIWKNDFENTRQEFKKDERIISDGIKVKTADKNLLVELPAQVVLTRFMIDFTRNSNCLMPRADYIETSLDGKNWLREKDSIPTEQISGVAPVTDERLIFFFAGRKAKYIRLTAESTKSCIIKPNQVLIYELE